MKSYGIKSSVVAAPLEAIPGGGALRRSWKGPPQGAELFDRRRPILARMAYSEFLEDPCKQLRFL